MRSADGSLVSGITPLFVLFYLLCGAVFALVLSYAWVTEDAYITFRVIDNFIHGYGLRWNVDERVQVYTHPLWMLVHIPFYVVFGRIFLVTIGVSAACEVAAVWTIFRCGNASYLQKSALVLLPLALSPTFCQYVISGLEVPLSLFLITLFFYYFIYFPAAIYRLLCIASLAVLTRFDNGVILLPALCWLVFSHRKTIDIGRAIAALSPFILWCVFSLFYYGFLFPNTKYAKLSTGIPEAVYRKQGLHYLENWLHFDAFSYFWVVAALVVSLYTLVILSRKGHQTGVLHIPFYAGVIAGIALHVVYVVMIGGDFMSGRFFVSPFFLAVLTVYVFSTTVTHARAFVLLMCVTVYVASSWVTPLPFTWQDITANHGIVSEREFYPDNYLLSGLDLKSEAKSLWADEGKHAISEKRIINNDYVTLRHTIGMYGYYAGPKVKIVDMWALADPLMARLPVPNHKLIRIGHFERELPKGYEYARRKDDFSQMDPDLAKYYEQLRLVTAGPLFSFDRMKTILGFQLGWYDEWLALYLNKN